MIIFPDIGTREKTLVEDDLFDFGLKDTNSLLGDPEVPKVRFIPTQGPSPF